MRILLVFGSSCASNLQWYVRRLWKKFQEFSAVFSHNFVYFINFDATFTAMNFCSILAISALNQLFSSTYLSYSVYVFQPPLLAPRRTLAISNMNSSYSSPISVISTIFSINSFGMYVHVLSSLNPHLNSIRIISTRITVIKNLHTN